MSSNIFVKCEECSQAGIDQFDNVPFEVYICTSCGRGMTKAEDVRKISKSKRRVEKAKIATHKKKNIETESQGEMSAFLFGIFALEFCAYKYIIWENWYFIIGCFVGLVISVNHGWILNTSTWKIRPIWLLFIGLISFPFILVVYSAWRAGHLI